MISKLSYSREWIEEKVKQFPKKSPELIEKVIMAFSLLERLKLSGLNFIFKGGTSLLLLIKSAHRFSIDIDIIIPKRPINFEDILNRVIADGIFLRYEEQHRNGTNDIPKAHYKFFYKSVLNGAECPILLDILYEDNPYSEIKTVQIESVFLYSEGKNIEVTLPSINCILGDKLTAYAPNTTGIPYGKGKELEIIKQLFDISKLFDLFDNINIVRDTFNVIAQKELAYRKKTNFVPHDVLDDIFITSCIIAFRGAKRQDVFKELSTGVTKIKGYIYSENYILESGVLSAGKAAYLSRLIDGNIPNIGDRFNSKIDLSSLLIPGRSFKQLNTIKKFSPEAFFYWYKAFELMEESSLVKLVENLK